MLSNKDKLNQIRKNLNDSTTIEGEFFLLARELGCLPELIGREYRFIYENGKIVGFKQLPMPISSFKILMDEFMKFKKMEAKATKRGRRR